MGSQIACSCSSADSAPRSEESKRYGCEKHRGVPSADAITVCRSRIAASGGASRTRRRHPATASSRFRFPRTTRIPTQFGASLQRAASGAQRAPSLYPALPMQMPQRAHWHGACAFAQLSGSLRRTAAAERRSHSWRAIVPTRPEPAMPMATKDSSGIGLRVAQPPAAHGSMRARLSARSAGHLDRPGGKIAGEISKEMRPAGY
jgi:hypothetical protein